MPIIEKKPIIIYNRTKHCYSIGNLIILPGPNKIESNLFESLEKHPLFQSLLKSHNGKPAHIKILKNKEKAIKQELENSMPAGIKQVDKDKIIDSVKINEIIGTFDEKQLGELSKEQKAVVNAKCKELKIKVGGKSYPDRVALIKEAEKKAKEEAEGSEEEDENESEEEEEGEE